MSAHAPSPWAVNPDMPTGILDARGYAVATTHWASLQEDRIANARLIAAAPEMLEALWMVRDLVHDRNLDVPNLGDIDEAIHAAIAKAKEES